MDHPTHPYTLGSPPSRASLIDHIVYAPPFVLATLTLSGILLAAAIFATGLLLYQPATTQAQPVIGAGPVQPPMPADFTPLASPPPAFAPGDEGEGALPTATAVPATPEPGVAVATPTAMPIDEILAQEAQTSELAARRLVTILLLGKDARPEEFGASRTDTIMVAVLDLHAGSATLISIPRDLWVAIPGFGEARINTAYFLGEGWSSGPALARQTVSQLLGIPISYTFVVDFDGFRQTIDEIGGIQIDVPESIDDPLFPDDSYGTYRLVIPAGPQAMDGQQALAYARTRHGSSDIHRAERQQLVMEGVRQKVLSPEQLPFLPAHIVRGASRVETDLSVPDIFFLARFARTLDRARIFNHVIRDPLLWNGVTADGQQVLLYDPYSVQQAVQQWLYEATLP